MSLAIRSRVVIQRGPTVLMDRKNLITNVGLAQIAGLLNASVSGAARYIALGTGTSPADPGDVILEDEVTFGGGERAFADTRDRITTLVENDTMRVQHQFDISTGFDLTELGLFNAGSEGILFAHVVFPAVTVSADQSLVITWTWQITEE